jgi:hypothetical protein
MTDSLFGDNVYLVYLVEKLLGTFSSEAIPLIK